MAASRGMPGPGCWHQWPCPADKQPAPRQSKAHRPWVPALRACYVPHRRGPVPVCGRRLSAAQIIMTSSVQVQWPFNGYRMSLACPHGGKPTMQPGDMRKRPGEHRGTRKIDRQTLLRARHTCRPSQYFLPAWRVVSSLMRISAGCWPASLLETMPTCRASTRFNAAAHAGMQY